MRSDGRLYSCQAVREHGDEMKTQKAHQYGNVMNLSLFYCAEGEFWLMVFSLVCFWGDESCEQTSYRLVEATQVLPCAEYV
jgi:hypothetical protein